MENNLMENSTANIDTYYFYEVEQFTVLWLLLITIVIGNCAVLITLQCGKTRKNRMNFFMTHLALADLSVGLISVLTDLVWRMTVSWNAGNLLCKFIKFLQVVVTYGSTYILVALSIDRYDAITHPMKFSGSWKRAKCLVVSAWFLSLLFSMPILVLYEEKEIQEHIQCWIDFTEKWHWRLYMTIIAVSLFIIPTAIIATCYTIIIITIWRKSAMEIRINDNNKSHLQTNKNGSNGSKRASSRGLIPRAKVKTVKITLVIVTVFILCWSPFFIFDLLQVYGHIPETQSTIAIATFIQSLAPLNSAANPIIYCIFSTHFCKTIGSYLPLGCRKKTHHHHHLNMTMSTNQTHTSMLSETRSNRRSVACISPSQIAPANAEFVSVH